MKNYTKLFKITALIAVIGLFALTGCTTTKANIDGASHGSFPVIDVAAKDFIPLGLVFVETETQYSRGGKNTHASGNVITYQALLKEAQKLGADAIVNVTIDVETLSSERLTAFSGYTMEDSENIKERWYGSALAIKYTDKLTQGDIASTVVHRDISSDGTQFQTAEVQNFFERMRPRIRRALPWVGGVILITVIAAAAAAN